MRGERQCRNLLARAVLTAIVPPPPSFLTSGEPHRPDAMGCSLCTPDLDSFSGENLSVFVLRALDEGFEDFALDLPKYCSTPPLDALAIFGLHALASQQA